MQRGQVTEALHQIDQFVAAPGQHSLSPLEVPALTHVRILIAANTAASLREAMDVLRGLHRASSGSYNRLRGVEVLGLRALVLEAMGESETALDVLEQAINVGEPGGMVRAFVDLGPPMAALLHKLAGRKPTKEYIGQLLAKFPHPFHPAIVASETEELEALTDREYEVLALMGQRLSNKEIAQHLTISPHTVKKHASNIYQKLDVSSRRQASVRAVKLGLLPAPDAGGPLLALA
jgi:LuxR family maltose regulon positive regulatory protein